MQKVSFASFGVIGLCACIHNCSVKMARRQWIWTDKVTKENNGNATTAALSDHRVIAIPMSQR